jgi:hypothetical protein
MVARTTPMATAVAAMTGSPPTFERIIESKVGGVVTIVAGVAENSDAVGSVTAVQNAATPRQKKPSDRRVSSGPAGGGEGSGGVDEGRAFA